MLIAAFFERKESGRKRRLRNLPKAWLRQKYVFSMKHLDLGYHLQYIKDM
jgi:hypothetical protein